MGVWRWAKHVVTDHTGGVEPIPVELERNPDAVVELGAHNPADVPLYLLRIGLGRGFARGRTRPDPNGAGAEARRGRGTHARVPVFRRRNPSPHPVLKEIYWCELAGKTLEAANIYALREKVQRQLEVLAPARSLPLCYFRAPRYDFSLAVYEEESRFVCPVLAGPKIKARRLSEIRAAVVRHLRTSGYLAADEDAEVLVVRPSDLRLVPPAAVIRCLDDPALWIPTVEGTSPEGPVIGLLAHSPELASATRRRAGAPAHDPPPSAPDVSALVRYIGHELAVKGHLLNPWTLYAVGVRAEIWARTEELTDATRSALSCHLADGGDALEVPVRRNAAGESVGAIREREISVFLAGDDDALAASIGRYLVASGFLRDAADLRTEVLREAPPEALAPESIRISDDLVFRPELFTEQQTNEDLEVEAT